jgi:hypothetical protein
MKPIFKSLSIAAVVASMTSAAYADCSNVVLSVRISPRLMNKITKIEYWGKGGKWRTAHSRGFFNNRGFTFTVGTLKSPSNTRNRFRVTAKQLVRNKITFGVQHNVYSAKQTYESNAEFCTNGMTYDLRM